MLNIDGRGTSGDKKPKGKNDYDRLRHRDALPDYIFLWTECVGLHDSARMRVVFLDVMQKNGVWCVNILFGVYGS